MKNLIYMAKPIYGGWVTFTSHLCLQNDSSIYKIGKRSEKSKRNFGYGAKYQLLKIDYINLRCQPLLKRILLEPPSNLIKSLANSHLFIPLKIHGPNAASELTGSSILAQHIRTCKTVINYKNGHFNARF